jgi:hypothetical protein
MLRCRRTIFAAIAAAAVAVSLSGPAAADNSGGPCTLTLSLLCRLVPMAPDLDHDVDLTTQLPPADPNSPAAVSSGPANVCGTECR